MKTTELREKTIEDLRKLLEDTQKKLVDTRFQLAIRKINSHADLAKYRKDIARILTIIREKEAQAN